MAYIALSLRKYIILLIVSIDTDGLIEEFCDGTRFSKYSLFSTDPYALQVIAYYDELEICNPLGSHVKQNKCGIVFYTLGNIAPKYRSQLPVINLAVIATVPIIELYGLDTILAEFISDINILATDGITVTEKKNFKGALLAFLADNLACNDLGGFKKSFSFSFRCCRSCLVTKDSIRSSYISEDFQLRTEDNHRKHVELLDGPTASHFSKTYGINRRSSLLDLTEFTMFDSGLPHDAMHDILEGIAPLEIKLLLTHLISSKCFTLDYFNGIIYANQV